MPFLVRLLVLVPVGFLLAVLAAAVALTVGLFRMFLDLDAIGYLGATVVLNALSIGYFALLPTLLAIIAAEWTRLRSVWFWGGIGLLLGILAQMLPWLAFGPAVQRIVSYGSAGLVGGLVFWLIAGRLSGTGYPPRQPSLPLGDQ